MAVDRERAAREWVNCSQQPGVEKKVESKSICKCTKELGVQIETTIIYQKLTFFQFKLRLAQNHAKK